MKALAEAIAAAVAPKFAAERISAVEAECEACAELARKDREKCRAKAVYSRDRRFWEGGASTAAVIEAAIRARRKA